MPATSRKPGVLSQLTALGRDRGSLQRRIDPGHSSNYWPGPADEADRLIRDPRGAFAEKQVVEAKMVTLVREYLASCKRLPQAVDRVNSAVGFELVWLQETAWYEYAPGEYRSSAYRIRFNRALLADLGLEDEDEDD